jgi:hypothetical protein
MDASRLTMTLAVLLVGAGLGRFILSTMGRAGDAMATLFVPPDQALGWPHGVQEGDEPWGWRGSASAPGPGADAGRDDGAGPGGGGGRSDEAREGRDPRSGSFVVPVDRVAPVRLGVRPH